MTDSGNPNAPAPVAGAASVLLFDLDGTLVDSVELIRRSWRHALAAHGLDEVPDRAFLSQMGRPLLAVMEEIAGEAERAAAMTACYRAFQRERHDDFLRVYDGVREAVLELRARGWRLGVVTSKPLEPARRGLAFAGVAEAFETIIGADMVTRHKPEPEPIEVALRQLGVAASDAHYVGDAPFDVQAGRAAGVGTVACLWGPFEREELAPHGPDHFAHSPLEWLDLFGHPAR